jgi:hypothetical protein
MHDALPARGGERRSPKKRERRKKKQDPKKKKSAKSVGGSPFWEPLMGAPQKPVEEEEKKAQVRWAEPLTGAP